MSHSEQQAESVHQFCNRLAMSLPVSNDTMAAIRLLRKELPALIAKHQEAERKAAYEHADIVRQRDIKAVLRELVETFDESGNEDARNVVLFHLNGYAY